MRESPLPPLHVILFDVLSARQTTFDTVNDSLMDGNEHSGAATHAFTAALVDLIFAVTTQKTRNRPWSASAGDSSALVNSVWGYVLTGGCLFSAVTTRSAAHVMSE